MKQQKKSKGKENGKEKKKINRSEEKNYITLLLLFERRHTT